MDPIGLADVVVERRRRHCCIRQQLDSADWRREGMMDPNELVRDERKLQDEVRDLQLPAAADAQAPELAGSGHCCCYCSVAVHRKRENRWLLDRLLLLLLLLC